MNPSNYIEQSQTISNPMLKNIYIVLLLLFMGWSCQPEKSKEQSNIPLKVAIDNDAFPYDLSSPLSKHKLPNKLAEVSGLSYVDNGDLALVQDEKGIIFMFEPDSGTVREENYQFEKKGDFEGVEIVEDTAYVIKSDGELFKVFPYKEEGRKVEKYATNLQRRNNLEGLGILPGGRQLLIACKATPNITGKKEKDHRAIYTFDLNTKALDLIPFLQIPITHIQQQLKDNEYTRLSKDLAEAFSAGGNLSFQPSAIAVHPVSENIYILASVGKLLLVFNKEKTLIQMLRLDSDIFKQPEGICFSPKGDLFIANEGKKGKGNILHFAPIASTP